MDIISLQAANKIMKKLNTSYNGMYETFVALQGQKRFTATKQFNLTDHTLEVYVDGVRAVENVDYAKIDNNTIEFATPLEAGTIVLMTTDVVGVPRYEVVNPPYDDTEIKQQIQEIKNALDPNGDGNIINIINEIKSEWENADNDIKLLINNKVNSNEFEQLKNELIDARQGKSTLNENINEIINSIPEPYDDTVIKADIDLMKNDVNNLLNTTTILNGNIAGINTQIGVINTNISDIQQNINDIQQNLNNYVTNATLDEYKNNINTEINSISNKVNNNFMILNDSETNYEYKLEIKNGVINATLTDNGKVDKTYDELILETVISDNIVLPNTLNECIITWMSDNESIISTNGVVNIPMYNTEVILTATITSNAINKEKVFNITVLGTNGEPTGE